MSHGEPEKAECPSDEQYLIAALINSSGPMAELHNPGYSRAVIGWLIVVIRNEMKGPTNIVHTQRKGKIVNKRSLCHTYIE